MKKPRVPDPVKPKEAWHPPDWELPDAAAIQALMAGTAEPEQQRRAMDWIITQASALYDMSFRPGGIEGQRATDFCEGRRFVGNHILLLARLNLSHFSSKKEPGEQG